MYATTVAARGGAIDQPLSQGNNPFDGLSPGPVIPLAAALFEQAQKSVHNLPLR
ncbi:MAG: hypothetical protein H0V62_15030 [Gammaproteobacteria bacterium]|nr:hypothetical protein [Gammaproteobacteria bacterium]MBA3732051.1 hypothetical protein [Gammaproteobacteria bacterium]